MCPIEPASNEFEARFNEILVYLYDRIDKGSENPDHLKLDCTYVIDLFKDLFAKYQELMEQVKHDKEQLLQAKRAYAVRHPNESSSDLDDYQEIKKLRESIGASKHKKKKKEKKILKKKKPQARSADGQENILEPEVNLVVEEGRTQQSKDSDGGGTSDQGSYKEKPSRKGKKIQRVLTEDHALQVQAFYRKHWKKGKSYTIQHFTELWGPVCLRTMYSWMRKLDRGESTKYDRTKAGRPRIELPPEKIQELIEMAKTDVNLSLNQLAKRYNINIKIVKRYLESANIKRLTSKEKRMLRCAMNGEEYRPFYDNYDRLRDKKNERQKILMKKKKGLIPNDPGDFMPDGRRKRGPKFKKQVPEQYMKTSAGFGSGGVSDSQSQDSFSSNQAIAHQHQQQQHQEAQHHQQQSAGQHQHTTHVPHNTHHTTAQITIINANQLAGHRHLQVDPGTSGQTAAAAVHLATLAAHHPTHQTSTISPWQSSSASSNAGHFTWY